MHGGATMPLPRTRIFFVGFDGGGIVLVGFF
jgi:hypothetical protein